jgi:predicted DNA-binding protein (UPF0251 family)
MIARDETEHDLQLARTNPAELKQLQHRRLVALAGTLQSLRAKKKRMHEAMNEVVEASEANRGRGNTDAAWSALMEAWEHTFSVEEMLLDKLRSWHHRFRKGRSKNMDRAHRIVDWCGPMVLRRFFHVPKRESSALTAAEIESVLVKAHRVLCVEEAVLRIGVQRTFRQYLTNSKFAVAQKKAANAEAPAGKAKP